MQCWYKKKTSTYNVIQHTCLTAVSKPTRLGYSKQQAGLEGRMRLMNNIQQTKLSPHFTFMSQKQRRAGFPQNKCGRTVVVESAQFTLCLLKALQKTKRRALWLRCRWDLGGSSEVRLHRAIRAQWCLSLQGSTPRFSW